MTDPTATKDIRTVMPWPKSYRLDEYVRNPCECDPAETTTHRHRARGLREYIAGRRNPNCPVHWEAE